VVACRLLFARLPDRAAPLHLAAASLGCSAAGLVAAAALPSAAGLLLAAALLAVGTAFLTPAVFSAIFRRVPPSQRGSAAGTASAFIDLGFSGGPFLLGLVAATVSIPAAFVTSAALTTVGAALLATHRTPRTPGTEPVVG
jgi:MFS family permease